MNGNPAHLTREQMSGPDGAAEQAPRPAVKRGVIPPGVIELADGQQWLARQEPGAATAIVLDPPYAVGSPVRGREDGAAGSLFEPFGFLHDTLKLCARALRPGGIVIIFTDWRRLALFGNLVCQTALRPSGCVAWVRTRPGAGGLFRASWDPVLVASRGTPDAVDHAAIRNVIETEDDVVYANYPGKRTHPYEKPVAVYEHILKRVCRPGELVLDPFAGSGSSRVAAEKLELRWAGCDVDEAFAETGDG